MNTLEEQLRSAGLQVANHCERLASYSPDLLEHSPLLEDFTAEEADVLAASMLLVRAQPGQVLIREGDAGDWMMLILKGTVDVTKHIEVRAEEGRAEGVPESLLGPVPDVAGVVKIEPTESRVAVLQRGAAIGEMSMLDSGLRYTTCTAIEPVEAGVLGSHAIGLLIRDHPGVGAKLLVKITQLMAQRLRNVSNQLVKLLQKT
jgi:CRP/FNR family transcriptional regulator, cyclic AMP receptor protein